MIPGILKRSLHAKVTVSIVLPLIAMLGAITLIEHLRHRAAVMDNLSSLAAYSGQMIESSLRHAMLASDFAEVQGILNTVSENQDIQTVYLLDISGEIMFAPDHIGVGTHLDNTHANCIPCHREETSKRPDSIIVTGNDGQRVFRSMHPIRNAPECAGCHDPDQPLLGLLLTDLSMAPVEASLAADLRENLLWGAATILIAVLVINLVMSRLVLHRLGKFIPAIEGLRHGELPQPIQDRQPDEIGHLAEAFNTMAGTIETRNAENQQLSEGLRLKSTQRRHLLERLITAQEDERKRVARELHDELGQVLSGLGLHAQAAERFIAQDPDRAVEQVAHMRRLATEATDRMYDLILDLRPSVLDDLGLAAALRVYAERLLAPVDLVFVLDAGDLTRRLPTEIETTLYRVFQEALCNVVRHAQATRVQVHLAERAGAFVGEVTDDGQGFDPAAISPNGKDPQGLGLLGMRERVTQCGGELAITSQPGSGTHLKLTIPIGEDPVL